MYRSDFAYGFRILGGCQNDRRLVDWPAAFAGYAGLDDRAQVYRESYLSAFCFGREFAELLNRTGTTRGYSAECWSPWLWLDVDREDLGDATNATRRLAATAVERFQLDGDDLLLFFSGGKGFHVGLPTSLFGPQPSTTYHFQCRAFGESLATVAGVVIDTGVYDRVRAFRAPNSRHPKTGLHKPRLSFDELLHVGPGRIVKLAREPFEFLIPKPAAANQQAAGDWRRAVEAVERQRAAGVERRSNGRASLNRQTLAFIRDGAATGDRHRLLFSAAANLGEFGCDYELAFALLSDAALDSGLPPAEVERQIRCGLAYRGGN